MSDVLTVGWNKKVLRAIGYSVRSVCEDELVRILRKTIKTLICCSTMGLRVLVKHIGHPSGDVPSLLVYFGQESWFWWRVQHDVHVPFLVFFPGFHLVIGGVTFLLQIRVVLKLLFQFSHGFPRMRSRRSGFARPPSGMLLPSVGWTDPGCALQEMACWCMLSQASWVSHGSHINLLQSGFFFWPCMGFGACWCLVLHLGSADMVPSSPWLLVLDV